jgi:hypothetical protein
VSFKKGGESKKINLPLSDNNSSSLSAEADISY